jgi:Domain of unknown function (DUF3560)
VQVEIDNVTLPTTSFAELEAERRQQAANRAERFGQYADNAAAQGTAMIEQVDAEREQIPLGQPHLIGHHSYSRTMRAEAKRNAKEDRGREHLQRGRRWARKADAAAGYQAGRQELGTTQRRIERLQADLRRHERALLGHRQQWEITVTTDWTDDYGKTLEERLAAYPDGSRIISRADERNIAEVHLAVSATARAEIKAQIALLTEEIAYWKAHITALSKGEGRKVYSCHDFSRGDFVRVGERWYEVVRVNSKTLTVANGVNSTRLDVVTVANAHDARGRPGWTDRLPYHEAEGQMTAAQARSRYPEAFTASETRQDAEQDGDTA